MNSTKDYERYGSIDYRLYDSEALRTINLYAKKNTVVQPKINWLIRNVVYKTPSDVANQALHETAWLINNNQEVDNKRVLTTLIFYLMKKWDGVKAVLGEKPHSYLMFDSQRNLALDIIQYKLNTGNIKIRLTLMEKENE